MESRQTIKSLSENCIRKEMKLCRKENLEQHIWKILYYNLIEYFKVLITDSKLETRSEYFQSKSIEIIEDGLAFYNHMLDVLQTTYNFTLSDLLETESRGKYRIIISVNHHSERPNFLPAKFKDNKFVQLALVSAQKYFLFLGDLSRYKETNKTNNNLASAKQYYLKAQRLIPSNGVPYNQLAFVALHSVKFMINFVALEILNKILLQKNKFSAVYYYIRSLMASNPIQTAKENLKVLFDEARKSVSRTLIGENRFLIRFHQCAVRDESKISSGTQITGENVEKRFSEFG